MRWEAEESKGREADEGRGDERGFSVVLRGVLYGQLCERLSGQ